jgi:hypothetical protein
LTRQILTENPWGDYHVLHELARDHFASARFCSTDYELGQEYARRANAELARVRAELGDAHSGPWSQRATTENVQPIPDPPSPPRRPRKPRQPSLRRLIADAERAGKAVASVTLADGTTLNFGESDTAAGNNPWLTDLAAKQ